MASTHISNLERKFKRLVPKLRPEHRHYLEGIHSDVKRLARERNSALKSAMALRTQYGHRNLKQFSGGSNGCMVAGTTEEQAHAICSAEGMVDVYRFASGAVTWRERGGKAPKGGEFIGTYDEGADYRNVLEDLQA